ncbi:BTAD domain-containing putative transcriptional regulator [Lentzea sp. NEAU-D7]|uniref:BTAD domain-containing putative transcriptional regulator n=1 Tax=Lentzea sp. NEAU-D7 TaxID=2994667 RepID=UPI00224B3090|nr:BTAD domain-containing putative transcriptional regulator [Lentzea sp. NEAU-D7]MCX2953679.1 BTAD domain-containing putative transcriptional regulator [Lentzea sp. NEAU-D7]
MEVRTLRFHLLGSLEVLDGELPVPLGGVKQRAALGFLLLQANRVVATSKLLHALWPRDVPPTARKMLQNAVSGLRGVLASPGGNPEGGPMLLTHAPGYLLRVDPNSLDLSRFQQLAEQGRAELAAGNWPAAAKVLRGALGLWRGPVLADLAETGINWPELTAIKDWKLAVQEDCFEAELACGRHGEIIGELESLIELEPYRERLGGQLMLALYRCGRQVDALSVYRRTRAALVAELGLEPGRELQELERAILDHTPTLDLPSSVQRRHLLAVGQDPAPARTPVVVTRPAVEPVAPAAVVDAPDLATAERKLVSVVMVSAQLGLAAGDGDPEDVDAVHQEVASVVSAEVSRLGGVVGGSVGSVFLALFGAPRTAEDDADRAVRASVAIRDRLDAVAEVQIGVATGNALVRLPSSGLPTASGVLLDQCRRLMASAPSGTVRACASTRDAADSVIWEAESAPAGGWQAISCVSPRGANRRAQAAVPFVERERELLVLQGLLDEVRTRRRPHFVTILGEAGMGKTRLVNELTSSRTTALRGTATAFGDDHGYGPLAEVVSGFSSFATLRADLVKLVGVGELADRLHAGLACLAEPAAEVRPDFPVWRRFLEEVAESEPLIVLLEDVHWANDVVLDFVEELGENAGSVPLLVIATARPELLQRRPSWFGGKRNATTISLEPLSHNGTRQLLNSLLQARELPSELWQTLVSCASGNPLFATEYAGMVADPRTPLLQHDISLPVPSSVRGVLTAQLDSLPIEVKAVLQDAALTGDLVSPSSVAATGQRDALEVAKALELLEQRDFLRRQGRNSETGEIEYGFRHLLVRDVVAEQIPRAERASKHERARAWLDRMALDLTDRRAG